MCFHFQFPLWEVLLVKLPGLGLVWALFDTQQRAGTQLHNWSRNCRSFTAALTLCKGRRRAESGIGVLELSYRTYFWWFTGGLADRPGCCELLHPVRVAPRAGGPGCAPGALSQRDASPQYTLCQNPLLKPTPVLLPCRRSSMTWGFLTRSTSP